MYSYHVYKFFPWIISGFKKMKPVAGKIFISFHLSSFILIKQNLGENMKKKNNKEEKKNKNHNGIHGHRIWKTIAIAVIAVFAVIIIAGVIRTHYIRSSFIKPTQAQIDYATKIATEKLQSAGVNSSGFQMQYGKRMRKMHNGVLNRIIIQVLFYNNSTTHTYLIDVDSGEILLHSQTDMYNSFGNQFKVRNNEKPTYPSGIYPRFFKYSVDAKKK